METEGFPFPSGSEATIIAMPVPITSAQAKLSAVSISPTLMEKKGKAEIGESLEGGGPNILISYSRKPKGDLISSWKARTDT